MNKIQGKDQTVVIYEVNNFSLFYFDDKIYIQKNRYDGLALGYQN